MRKFNKNKGPKYQKNKKFRGHKRDRQDPRANIDYNALHASKVDTSASLLASFTHRTVRPRHGESSEALIKRFKTVIEKSGVMSELKRREHHKSKGEKAREKAMKARKRARKNMKRNRK